MNIIAKPLTAFVSTDKDTASIEIKNESGTTVLGPLTYHHISASANWRSNINDHLGQLVYNGMNIVNLETTETGIKLPTKE